MQLKKYNRQIIDLKQDDKKNISINNKLSGYCKLETRDNKLRIKISISGPMDINKMYKAYLIKTNERTTHMIPIGVIEVDNSSNNLNITTDATKIMGQNIGINEISIIAIMYKDDNDKFNFPLVGYIKEINYPWKDNIIIDKKIRKKEVVSEDIKVENKENNSNKQINNNENSLIEKDINGLEDNQIHNDCLVDEEIESNNDTIICSNEKIETESCCKCEDNGSIEIEDIGNQTFDIIKNHFDEEELAKIHDNLFREYPQMRPFEGKYSDVEWIRIEPSDIIYFPIESWLLTNNTFLLNAYRKYKHLILGRNEKCRNEKAYFILGVPGIYFSKDRLAAYFYGFKDFICCSGAKTKAGEYGYWIKEIDY